MPIVPDPDGVYDPFGNRRKDKDQSRLPPGMQIGQEFLIMAAAKLHSDVRAEEEVTK
jgi:hypothetical protein